MNDPFEIEKARKGPSMTPGFDRKAAAAKFEEKDRRRVESYNNYRAVRGPVKRGSTPYTQPTGEQRAAQHVRRVEQAVARASKPYIRHPTAVPKWTSHIKPGPSNTVITSSALALAAGGAVHHNNKVHKADRRNRNTALGGIAGLAAADAGSMATGQATKAGLKVHRAKVGTSQVDERIWTAHKRKHGVVGQTNKKTPNSVKVAIHRTYPKELPGWRVQRALAVKNKPEVYGATLAAGALGGAAIARRRSVNKAAPKKLGLRAVKNSLTARQGREAVFRTTAVGVPATYVASQYKPSHIHKSAGEDMAVSAFGVDHGDIAKGITTAPWQARRGIQAAGQAVKGFGRASRGQLGPAPTAAGALGAKMGKPVNVGFKKVTGMTPRRQVAAGAGLSGLGGGAVALHRKNKF